jgi:transcriptional regulator with XRE-family HTH domain
MRTEVVGWKLARERRSAGLSQAEVAARMGTTQSAISRLEAGRVVPSIDAIERFALALGRPISLTFGDAKSPALSRAQRRKRLRRALGEFRFDPWQREPSEAEARSLLADGLTRERG